MERVSVYDTRTVAPRFVVPASATVSCLVSDSKSERINMTRPNSGCERGNVGPGGGGGTIRRVGAARRDGGRARFVGRPVGRRDAPTHARELRLRGDRSGRLERRAVEALGGGAAEVADTAAYVRRVPGLSLPAPQSPREADARREVPVAWQPIDPHAEQGLDRRVRERRAVESGGLDPDTVHDVETRSRMPGVAGVQRGVPGRPVNILGGKGTAERGWAVGGERR